MWCRSCDIDCDIDFQVAYECKIAFHTCDTKHMMYLQQINGRLSAKIHCKTIKIAKGKCSG